MILYVRNKTVLHEAIFAATCNTMSDFGLLTLHTQDCIHAELVFFWGGGGGANNTFCV